MFLVVAAFALSGVTAFDNDVQNTTRSKLPELYQIDDYDRCLSRPGALYCAGTFRLTADRQAPSYRYYRMIEEYSSEPRHFNRTLLHRGYCLSSRCPDLANATHGDRFSSCAQAQEVSLGMKLVLQSYHCSQNVHKKAIEKRDQHFLWIVAVLLALNVLGTVYDVKISNGKKNKVLKSWSIRFNWQSLKNTLQEYKDPRLKCLSPFEGFRVIFHVLFIVGHIMAVYHQLFLSNPQHVEQLYFQSWSYFMRNGQLALQAFVMASSFLYTHSQIIFKRSTHFSQLPLATLRRIARLLPVHLLVVGFAATWWRYTGDGPLWPNLVLQESDVCRRKFLWHALFLHNLVDNDDHCLAPTWSFAADLQLFVAAYLLMSLLTITGRKPLPVLSVLFIVLSVLNGLMAYCNGWESMIFIALPENLRQFFRNSRSFTNFYLSPLNNVPAYLVGIILAHVHKHVQERGIKLSDSKLYLWCYHLSFPLMISWVMCGEWFFERRSPLTTAIYAAIERPVFLLLLSVYSIGIINNLDNVVRRVALWRFWRPLGRMSLSMLTVHWCVIKTLLASRRGLFDFNQYNLTMDTLATIFLSYGLAVPLTLLVEMPLMKTFTSMLMD
ncbi:uncharacterized protein LOC121727666 isoform X2 [Aricia agestis]|uniref:uncharacterized protein LOC121727666 isoform X2 n=1 Tax=Aricia agestis TaxID=91739 RepID=UPI001C20A5B4|nr:uncharacterized protein LOC121727666 isoform X2 [Aricia agestis]